MDLFGVTEMFMEPGPALSRCNRCGCIGPRAMVFGQVGYCQILFAPIIVERLINFIVSR